MTSISAAFKYYLLFKFTYYFLLARKETFAVSWMSGWLKKSKANEIVLNLGQGVFTVGLAVRIVFQPVGPLLAWQSNKYAYTSR